MITLKAARVNSEMTQKQAASKLGVSEQTLSNYERYISYPDVPMLLKMQELYNITFDQVTWKQEQQPVKDAQHLSCP